MIPGWTAKDGERQYPVVAYVPLLSTKNRREGNAEVECGGKYRMVANLAKPTPSRPALMKHNDVVT